MSVAPSTTTRTAHAGRNQILLAFGPERICVRVVGKIIPQRIRGDGEQSAIVAGKPEILAPAGDWQCVRAAVENGADAVYFGLERFNARLRAHNFTEADLPELMAWLHERGVKGYVTFNTLVFTDELAAAESFLRTIIAAGADAAIVQDVGICRMIRELSPDFPIHASTQMSVTSEAGVAFARELGCSVVVLARECSLNEVAAIRRNTLAAATEVPLEIFVHGALCVAYSGQCLTSEALGGRSANRGECAQACRLPYELIADGKTVPLGDKRYLLSPQDLAGIDIMPEIVRSGVATLKIEGRLKNPEYVAAVTAAYRNALDRAWEAATADAPAQAAFEVPPEERYQLEMTFSRGLSTGWLHGIDNQRLVHARFGKKRGVYLGEVATVVADGVWLRAAAPMKVGDGVVFDAGRPDLPEEGARIFQMRSEGARVFISFQRGSLDLAKVRPGQKLWKTSDPELDKELRRSWQTPKPAPASRRALRMQVRARVGEPARLIVEDEHGRRAEAFSSEPVQRAEKHATDAARLRAQLERLGDTPFVLAELECALDADAMVPASQLNQLRRDAIDALMLQRRSDTRWTLRAEPLAQTAQPARSAAPAAPAAPARVPLIPYARSLAQIEALAPLAYPELYIELEDPRKYPQAVAMARAGRTDRSVWIAPPRIYKTGEDWIIKQLERSEADGLLARNHEHLRAWQGRRTRGDFSLNIANPLAARWFIERWGLERLTVSYDLNAEQVKSLLAHAPAGWFEITLHQHMPMFHMEHCVFCAFLSTGKDFRDCGRPCDHHAVTLKDRVGAAHPLKADAGCRNTLYNARAQTGAEYATRFAALGAAAFRIEFLNETSDEVLETMDRYERLLAGDLSGTELWRELKLINQLGVTRGTLR